MGQIVLILLERERIGTGTQLRNGPLLKQSLVSSVREAISQGVGGLMPACFRWFHTETMPTCQRSKRRLERAREQVGAGCFPYARSSNPGEGGVCKSRFLTIK